MNKKVTILKRKKIFITGIAGFIGSYLTLQLLRTVEKVNIIGLDNMNDYYDVSIKEWRLSEIEKEAVKHPESSWTFIKGSIADKELVDDIFNRYKPDIVVNLAAQAGGALFDYKSGCIYRIKSHWLL